MKVGILLVMVELAVELLNIRQLLNKEHPNASADLLSGSFSQR